MADARRPALAEGLNKELAAAFETRDFAAVAEMFTDDATLLPPRQGLISGQNDIKSYWARARRLKELKFESEIVTPLANDVTRDIGTFRMRLAPGRGRRERAEAGNSSVLETRELAGKYVFVWRKVGSEWKLETGIWNITKQRRGRQGGMGRRGGGGGGQRRRRMNDE
jgi:ketosteroid isomerase-like protein